MNHSRWNILPPAPASLLGASKFPRLITQLLYNRGLTDPAQFDPFINGDDRLTGDPFLLPDMQKAVTRLYRALLSGETIAIYGDFDVDGITATAILVQGLSILGGKAIPYIPHRLTEGYGIKSPVLEKLRREGVRLVVTVDCGITALPEVKRARRIGQDLIITDHHVPLPELPPATAVVSARLPGSTYPFNELTGAGIAFKLLQALLDGIGKEKRLGEFLDLVALGTVADMAPLLGENRSLVRQGLKLINSNTRLGIREIVSQAGIGPEIDADCISWALAPRLNAAGRLAHAMTSYNLLTTVSPEEARELAISLEQKNTERQRLTTRALAKAREQVLARGIAPILIVADSDYPLGVAGLVANKLAEEFYRPAVVIRTGEYQCSGSCRSVAEFNIILALQECRRLFTHFGGHAQAAGFTLPTKNLAKFEQVLTEIATSQLKGIDLRPRLDVDTEARLRDLAKDIYPLIQRLQPFGRGNPQPAFLSRRVDVVDCRTMGNSGDHIRLRLRQNGTYWNAVAFRLGNYLSEIVSPLDIVYNLELDRWGGEEHLRLNILDFAPSR